MDIIRTLRLAIFDSMRIKSSADLHFALKRLDKAHDDPRSRKNTAYVELQGRSLLLPFPSRGAVYRARKIPVEQHYAFYTVQVMRALLTVEAGAEITAMELDRHDPFDVADFMRMYRTALNTWLNG